MKGSSGKGRHGYETIGHDCIACADGTPHSALLCRYYVSEGKRLGCPSKVRLIKPGDTMLGYAVFSLSVGWLCWIALCVVYWLSTFTPEQLTAAKALVIGALIYNLVWSGITLHDYYRRPWEFIAKRDDKGAPTSGT